MPDQETAFIVMPIGRPGTDDHRHFQSLYEGLIRPTVAQYGYEVQRADDSQLSGAIAKDIVQQLAESELVIADLTTGNPNVFYEIGVRHSLRRNGTILIIDELRTENIPFDLSGYRAVKFRGDVEGVLNLQGELRAAIDAHRKSTLEHRDNPVHDFLPALPADALAGARGTQLDELQKELAEARELLRAYGPDGADRGDTSPSGEGPRALSVVVDALADARDGNLMVDLVDVAERAAVRGDRENFLGLVRRILEHSEVLDARSYVTLAARGNMLGLRSVALAMYDEAHREHPRDEAVRNARLAHLTHSQNGNDRRTARDELRQIIGVEISADGTAIAPEQLTDEQLDLLGLILDAYHADGLHDEALRITDALLDKFPHSAPVVRNYARALENSGNADTALAHYLDALGCADADDTSARWLGNTLHNMSRHVDGLECYLVACLLDPSDGANFAYVANELAFALEHDLSGTDRSNRDLPDSISADTVRQAITAALSAGMVSPDALRRCSQAAQRAEIHSAWMMQVTAEFEQTERESDELMKRPERYRFALDMYHLLRPTVTKGIAVIPLDTEAIEVDEATV